jgi:hypothetical protein
MTTDTLRAIDDQINILKVRVLDAADTWYDLYCLFEKTQGHEGQDVDAAARILKSAVQRLRSAIKKRGRMTRGNIQWQRSEPG